MNGKERKNESTKKRGKEKRKEIKKKVTETLY